MAVKWDGFSEDDIEKLKSKGNDSTEATRKVVQSSPLVVQKRATLSLSARRSCERDRLFSTAASDNKTHHADIPEQARLSKPKVETNGTPSENSSEPIKPKQESDLAAETASDENGGVKVSEPALTPTQSIASSAPAPPFTLSRPRSLASALMAPALTASPLPVMDVDDFESRQKLMEEQNRMKKVFLSKALEDRKKQASAEAKRLNMIQEELQKLDQRLSCDVSIIRNQIESASIEFLEAQKRYDRAEKEFLEAKMLFFTKLERKELLTHHLCTIIEQNEMRKAQKLSELMEKLDLRAELPAQNPEQEPSAPAEKSVSPSTDAPGNVKRKVSAEVILSPNEAGGLTGNAILASSKSPETESTNETSITAK